MGLLSFLGTASAGTLYSLREDGVLRSYDPSTGEVRVTVTLARPGKVVRRAHALAVDPRSGDVLGLASFVDDCHADPSRTRFLPNDSCDSLTSPAECEIAFMRAGSPVGPTSCVWTGAGGCRSCQEPFDHVKAL